ncbi:MAG: hypothetical protein J0M18_13125 [Ignavibacteria bacterium]|jgi:hypothetical protein|nr:hypothetical protein [Ignavibacteria bacterium]
MRVKFFYFAAVIFMFIAVNVFAQYTKPEVPPPPPPVQDDDKNLTAPLSVEESAYMAADVWKFHLKLTDTQYKEVYNITLAAFKKKEKLWDAGKENVIDKAEMEERLQKIDEGTDALMKDVLTEEQYEKYMSKRKD